MLAFTTRALMRTAASRAAFSPAVRHASAGSAHAQAMLQQADAVCFDVDSTVIDEEGIDVLAAHLGKGSEVAALTLKAMSGGMGFREAMEARLALMRPTRASIAECLDEHPPKLNPGMGELVRQLHARGTHVFLVSGGFRLMIEPVAEALAIPAERVYANTIEFAEDGTYEAFDADEPTSTDTGKPTVIAQLKADRGYGTVVMVGDGCTDLAAKTGGAADAFIGFGGTAVRETVKREADWFVYSMDELLGALDGPAR